VSFAIWLAATVAMFAVRAPHLRKSFTVRVSESRESALDRALVLSVSAGLVLPLVWRATGWLSFAELPFSASRLGAGVACFAAGLYLLHRSHADLGASWSNTLELREGHRLVTSGVYRHVRHPMYVALLLHAAGQALVIPNLVAGLAFVVPFAVLVASRLGNEERMMRDAFGERYAAYAASSHRLVPGLF